VFPLTRVGSNSRVVALQHNSESMTQRLVAHILTTTVNKNGCNHQYFVVKHLHVRKKEAIIDSYKPALCDVFTHFEKL